MNKYILGLLLVLVYIHIIVASGFNSVIYELDNCSSNIVLLDAINKTIENTKNTTSKELLYEIVVLLEKLDCNTLDEIIRFIRIRQAYTRVNQRYSVINKEYSRLNYSDSKGSDNKVTQEKYHNSANTNIMVKENHRFDPILVIINVVSIASFVIGIYIFRLIKKRIDYI